MHQRTPLARYDVSARRQSTDKVEPVKNRESQPGTKLTKEDVLEIVARCRKGELHISVARDFPVTSAMVGRIMNGLNWSQVTGIEPHKTGYAKGEAVSSAKLTRDQVLEIVRRCEAGERYGSVARDFPVKRGQVANIMQGKHWAHVTGIERSRRQPRGEDVLGSKLTESDVLEIVRRYEAGDTQTEIARDFPVRQSQVSNILKGKSWAHLTGIESD